MKAALALAPLALLATPAIAQDAAPVPPDAGAAAADIVDQDSLTIGAGAAWLPDYEGSNDYSIVPAPGAIGSYRGFNFTLAGNRLSVDLIPNAPGAGWDLQLGPVGVVNFNRTSADSIEDPRVRALGELDTAIELGGYVGVGKTGVITSPYDRLSISVSYRHDVSGVHRSGIATPTVTYFTPLSRKAAVGLFVSAERAERGYARTYYSVLPGQVAASGLPAFAARGGWKNWGIGALGGVSLTGDLLHGLKLVGGVNYRRLFDRFADSPIVRIAGSRDQWLGAVGLAYTF